jgi:extracellular elastinolytic metalloproteinase
MKDLLVERQNLFQQEIVTTDQITMSGLPPKDDVLDSMYRLHRWCKHVRSPYVLSETGLVKHDDVADPRNALLQFIVSVIRTITPRDVVLTEILNNRDHIIENMTSSFEAHVIGDNHTAIVEMIDNVPGAVSPIRAKSVYFQLPDGDRTTLVQAWQVSETSSVSCTSF